MVRAYNISSIMRGVCSFLLNIYVKYINLHICAIYRLIYTHMYSLYVHVYLPIQKHMCMLMYIFIKPNNNCLLYGSESHSVMSYSL